jgi:hypothetical protein
MRLAHASGSLPWFVGVLGAVGCGLSLTGTSLDVVPDAAPAIPTNGDAGADPTPNIDRSDASDPIDTEGDSDSGAVGTEDSGSVDTLDSGLQDSGADSGMVDDECTTVVRRDNTGVKVVMRDVVPKPRRVYGGHCYWVTANAVPWGSITGECEKNRGGYAVAIRNATGGALENAIVRELRAELGIVAADPWMGLARYRIDNQGRSEHRWIADTNLGIDYDAFVPNAQDPGYATRVIAVGPADKNWLETNPNGMRRAVCERIYRY